MRSGKRQATIQPVTVVDASSGTDLIKVHKILSQLHASESDTVIMCSGNLTVAVPAVGTYIYLGWPDIKQVDEFPQASAMFLTYNIRHILFDVIDIAPNVSVPGMFSTVHTGGGTITSGSFADVVDRPDSQSLAPGTGKISLVWSAKTMGERDFYPIDSTLDFGGLHAVFGSSTGASPKYFVTYRAVVHFRGRR